MKWRWKKNSKLPGNNHQRIFAITTLKDQGDSRCSYITKKNIHRDIELPATFEGNISVLVNPFSRNFPDYDHGCGDSSVSSDYQPIELTKLSTNPLKDKAGIKEQPSRQSKVTLEVTTAETPPGELRFFGQLKSKFLDISSPKDCDDSHSADEYFSSEAKDEDKSSETSFEVVNSLLNSMVDNVVKSCEKSDQSEKISKHSVAVHPYHSHFLLYGGVYDSCRTLYAFNTLKNILLTNSRLFLCCSATSGKSFLFCIKFILFVHSKKKTKKKKNF